MLLKRLSTLRNRPDFRRNPCRALWRRIVWHTRWKCVSQPWVITLRNEIQISVPRGGAGALIYYQGESEPLTNRFIRSFLQTGMSFWDVGAHIGEHTLLAARAVGTTGEIHAFEPSPEICSLLSLNIRSNSLRNIRINQLAVSDTCKETILELFEEPSISRLRPSSLNDINTSVRQTKVQCVSLGAYLRDQRIPNLIKIDVEGAELEVLRGMGELLSLEASETPVIIFEFCHANTQRFGYEPIQIIRHLQNFGFGLYWLSENSVIPVRVNSKHFELHYPENNLIAAKTKPCVHSV